ncbi:uncharacterized protein LOC130134384 [Syzygium oleosum]|uniref:uncharacterized protein LOC130134384 n=1 Tax=Syzygium oleosum TaxID=219896 RepID=UPI0011D2367C|nr:uncharacterized protein LOC130134384 [Syzygium oleosum]
MPLSASPPVSSDEMDDRHLPTEATNRRRRRRSSSNEGDDGDGDRPAKATEAVEIGDVALGERFSPEVLGFMQLAIDQPTRHVERDVLDVLLESRGQDFQLQKLQKSFQHAPFYVAREPCIMYAAALWITGTKEVYGHTNDKFGRCVLMPFKYLRGMH